MVVTSQRQLSGDGIGLYKTAAGPTSSLPAQPPPPPTTLISNSTRFVDASNEIEMTPMSTDGITSPPNVTSTTKYAVAHLA